MAITYTYIKPSKVTASACSITDETVDSILLGEYFNSGISAMNVALKLNMPIIDVPVAETSVYGLDIIYPVLPAQFMLTCLVNYVAYAIKAQDSSTTEAEAFYQKYLQGLNSMASQLASIFTGDNAIYLVDTLGYAVADLSTSPYLVLGTSDGTGVFN